MEQQPGAEKPKTATKSAGERNKAPGVAASGRKRADWEAIERDFRTGHFTLRELEAKHGVSYAQISRTSTKQKWTKDLREVIKQATDAALLRETVTGAQKDATETVLVAAELNSKVILGHRKDLAEARSVAAGLLDELKQSTPADQEKMAAILAGEGADEASKAAARTRVNRALSVGVRVASIKQLTDTLDKIQVAERRAFGLDDKPERQPNSLADMATDELKRMREALRNGG